MSKPDDAIFLQSAMPSFHVSPCRSGSCCFWSDSSARRISDYEFELPVPNNQVLLEDVEKQLALHKRPLRLRAVNNVPPAARPGSKTLAANFQDGDRLELVAEIAPGDSNMKALIPVMTLLFIISCVHGLLYNLDFDVPLACRTYIL